MIRALRNLFQGSGKKPPQKTSSETDTLTPLLLTAIWSYLPISTHHAYVCSAGSLGYHALKEMLQNGIPGNTLLLESGDLREVGTSPEEQDDCMCCYVYTSFMDSNRSTTGTLPDLFNLTLPPSYIRHISIYANTMYLPSRVLSDCAYLRTVDLSPLRNTTVTGIEKLFLSSCRGLVALDLGPLSHVTHISDAFLAGCTGLKSLDLSPLSPQLGDIIPRDFLYNCPGLTTTLDLTPLAHVTVLGESFLARCSGLTTLDLSPLSNVVEIQDFFLYQCSGLISLPNMGKMTKVEAPPPIFRFLMGCRSLLSLDFSELQWSLFLNSRLLLEGCSGLVEVSWPPEKLNVPPSGWEQRKGADTPNLHTWRRINQQQ